MANIGELAVAITADPKSLTTLTKAVQTEMAKAGESIDALGKKSDENAKKISSSMKDAGKSAGTFKDTLKAIFAFDIGTKIVTGIKSIITSTIDLASSLEQTKIAFTTMTGDARIADAFIREMTQFAKTTPFEIGQIETASKQLLAYGFAVQDVIPTLKIMGDISSGVGMEKLPNLIMALGQVKAATRLTGNELRQFTEAGVPLLGELGKTLGKSAGEIQKMVEKGQIGYPMVEKALASLTSEGGRFNNLMEQQSKSFGGMMSNFKDTITIMLRDLGYTFIPKMKDALQSLFDFWDENGKAISTSFAVFMGEVVGFMAKGIEGMASLFDIFGNFVQDKAKTNTDSIAVSWKNLFLYWAMGLKSISLAFQVIGAAIGYGMIKTAYDTRIAWAQVKNFFHKFAADFTGIVTLVGTNIGAAISGGVWIAVQAIDGLISLLNEIPGINIDRIGDSFKRVEFIGINSAFKQADALLGYTGDALDEIEKITMEKNVALQGAVDDTKNMIQKSVDEMSDSYDKFRSAQQANVEKGKTLKDVLEEIGKVKPPEQTKSAGTGGENKAKKQTDEQKSSLDKLKDAYSEFGKKQQEIGKISQELHEKNMKRYDEYKKEINNISDKLKKNEEDRIAGINRINDAAKAQESDTTKDYIRNLAERQVEAEKNLKTVSDKQFEAGMTGENYLEYLKERQEAEKKLEEIKSNLANLSKTDNAEAEKILAIERERSKLSDEKRAEYDYKAKLAEIAAKKTEDLARQEAESAKVKADLETQKSIYEFFQKKTQYTREQLAKDEEDARFKTLTGDQQNLFNKLGAELILLTDQRNKKIALEQEVATAAIDLSNRVNDVAMKNIAKLKLEYTDLINTINAAVTAQKALDQAKSIQESVITKGFAEGGYTGDGGKHDVAGLVHKGEYVMSQNMLSKIPGIVPALESIRTGNQSFDQSRTVAINGPINMGGSTDLDSLIRKAKFIM